MINYAAATTAPFYNFAPLRAYPPVNRIGQVQAHDQPYAAFGHKGRYRCKV